MMGFFKSEPEKVMTRTVVLPAPEHPLGSLRVRISEQRMAGEFTAIVQKYKQTDRYDIAITPYVWAAVGDAVTFEALEAAREWANATLARLTREPHIELIYPAGLEPKP